MTQARALTPQQVKRYSRHIIMGQVGSLGQRKLINAKVLIIGAGGLGSPSAVYLALAGVGTIGIVDFDVVEVSNLQRQILHHNDDVGRPKVMSAQDSLHAYNPDVNVVVHETRISSENASGNHRAVRHRNQRRRQLPLPLPGQRRLLPAGQAPRRRQHPHFRWSGHRVHARAAAATGAYSPRRLLPAWSPTARKPESLAP